MEANLIIWQDSETLAKVLDTYGSAVTHLNSMMGKVMEMGIVPDTEILRALCTGNSSPLANVLTAAMQLEAEKFILPYLKENVLAQLPGLINKGAEIVYQARQGIETIGDPNFRIRIDPSLLAWNESVIFDSQPIIDSYTIYGDTETKAGLKEMADLLIESIWTFNEYVHTVSGGKVKGFGSNTTYRKPLITVHTDGSDPDLDGKLFKHIQLD